jgi:hypothetical protein
MFWGRRAGWQSRGVKASPKPLRDASLVVIILPHLQRLQRLRQVDKLGRAMLKYGASHENEFI